MVPSGGDGRQWHLKCVAYVHLLRNLVLVAVTAENPASQRQDVGNGSRLFSAFVAISGYSTLTFIQNVWRFEVVLNILFFFFFFNYLFTAVLGLRFCARAFPSCGKRGPLLIAVRGPLTTAASLVAEHRLQTRRLSSCGPRAQPLRGMRDPPGPGPEPASPASAGRLSTTAPPGKP